MVAEVIRFRLNQRSVQRTVQLLTKYPFFLHGRLHDAFQEDAKQWLAIMNQRLAGNPLQSRSGKLRRSLRYFIRTGTLAQLRLRIVSRGVVYALMQQLGSGGKLPRKTKGYYSIPIGDNLTAAGVRKVSAKQARAQGAFIIGKHGADPAFMVKRVSRGQGKGSLKFLFKLVKGPIKIKPRLGFFLAWRMNAPTRQRRYAKALALALKDAKV